MSRINSRKKGSKNERRVAALFSEWTGKKFARTPSSGGLNWKNTHVAGDIVCTEEGHFFPFSVETKNHREINFEHLLLLDNPKIGEFWAQAKRDSEKARKIPLLLMRYDNMPRDIYFLALPLAVFNLIFTENPPPVIVVRNKSEIGQSICILKSDAIFKTDYRKIRATLKSSKVWPRK